MVIPKRGLAMHVECGERGKILSDECDGPTCMVTHTPNGFFSRRCIFTTAAVESHMTENEDIRKRNMEQFDQCFY